MTPGIGVSPLGDGLCPLWDDELNQPGKRFGKGQEHNGYAHVKQSMGIGNLPYRVY